ncbi:MAG: beta-galactosidase trimerization domain-containing protein [Chloroflexia bacterium]
MAHLKHDYRPLAARNIPVDIVSADAPLDGYCLVIAPALILLSTSRAAKLQELVARGTHLLLTARCGRKDEYDALLPARQPGFLRDCTGVEVEEYCALAESVPVQGDGISGSATIWAERLRRLSSTTRVLARYGASNGWLDGQAAVAQHPFGLGRVYYVGAWLKWHKRHCWSGS